jgi:hypothetical protein
MPIDSLGTAGDDRFSNARLANAAANLHDYARDLPIPRKQPSLAHGCSPSALGSE